MTTMGKCPICDSGMYPMHRDPTFMGGSFKVECRQCGHYLMSDSAHSELRRLDLNRGLLCGWIRRQVDAGKRVILDEAQVREVATLPTPTFTERVEGYLLAASKKANKLDDPFPYVEPEMRAAAYCTSGGELQTIVNYLRQQRYLAPVEPGAGVARLLPEGHMACDELRAKRTASSQGFIAMWFDASMEEARKIGLEPGIRAAGYKPHRVDDVHHIDQISDRIIAEIRRSRFLVADLTGHRQGVYYEAGFARGLDKPVFYSCRDDDKEKIHFDIRQFNCIMWKDCAELMSQLRDRIEAVIGIGPEPL
jgi:nucleoside 2-deoxyribosyltransferase